MGAVLFLQQFLNLDVVFVEPVFMLFGDRTQNSIGFLEKLFSEGIPLLVDVGASISPGVGMRELAFSAKALLFASTARAARLIFLDFLARLNEVGLILSLILDTMSR